MARSAQQTASLTAENTFTDPVSITGVFTLSATGVTSNSNTVTLQRSFDNGSTWVDIESYTEDTQKNGAEYSGDVIYRIGIKTGDFTGGTTVVGLYK